MRSRRSPDSGAGMTSPPTHQNRLHRISIPDSAQHKSALARTFYSGRSPLAGEGRLPVIAFPPPPPRSAFSPLIGANGQVTFGALPPLVPKAAYLWPVMLFPADAAARERLLNAYAAAVWTHTLENGGLDTGSGRVPYRLTGTAAAKLANAPKLTDLSKRRKEAGGRGWMAGLMLYFILQCAAGGEDTKK